MSNIDFDDLYDKYDKVYCKKEEIIIDTDICKNCNSTIEFDDTCNCPILVMDRYCSNFKQGYNRVTHFREIIKFFTSCDIKYIPNFIYELFSNCNLSKITRNDIRYILKKNHFTKYVECTHSIYTRLTKTQPLEIPQYIQSKLIVLFKLVERAFDNIQGKQPRINFLNYHYILYKLLEKLNYRCVLKYINLISSYGRLEYHNKIYREICNQLGWVYIPTFRRKKKLSK
jgi:hypothetical protein